MSRINDPFSYRRVILIFSFSRTVYPLQGNVFLINMFILFYNLLFDIRYLGFNQSAGSVVLMSMGGAGGMKWILTQTQSPKNCMNHCKTL